MDDRIEFAIIRFEGKNHLCYRNDDSYIDVSMPILNFTEGKITSKYLPRIGYAVIRFMNMMVVKYG